MSLYNHCFFLFLTLKLNCLGVTLRHKNSDHHIDTREFIFFFFVRFVTFYFCFTSFSSVSLTALFFVITFYPRQVLLIYTCVQQHYA